MRILVLGGGLMGVTTAYALAQDGHEVMVVDRAADVAAGTSFANAGLVTPSNAASWAAPGAPLALLRSLLQAEPPVRLRPTLQHQLPAWCREFLRNCTAERFRANTLVKFRLCRYSQQVLHDLVEETRVEFDNVRRGLLFLYRRQEALDRAVQGTRLLAEAGQRFEVIGAADCLRLEPALEAAGGPIAGAVYCPTDESGDARRFTAELAERCRLLGVEFAFGASVEKFQTSGDQVTAVVTGCGVERADGYVLALGTASPGLAHQLGVRLPITPVKGYSVTVPIGGANQAPVIGGVDKEGFMAWARFGDRLRFTAGAEIGAGDTRARPGEVAALVARARALFPNGADYARARGWAGLRPMTPSGLPVLGRGRHRNLWFNTGQGHMGWTMACGSARVTADLIAGRPPEIDITGLTLDTRL